MQDLTLAVRAALTTFNLVRQGGVKEAAALALPTWQRNRPVEVATDYASLAGQGYGRNTLIYACISALATSASEAPPCVTRRGRGGQRETVEGHPLTRLLTAPNPAYSGFELVEDVLTCVHIDGNAYLEKERGNGGQVVRLWPLRPDRVSVVPGGDFVRGYLYDVGDGRAPIPLAVNDVVHFKLPNPLNAYYGQSPMAVLARVGDLDNASIDWMRLFFENAAVPLGILSTRQRLNEAEAERIKARWQGQLAQSERWHSIAVLDSEASYQKVGVALDELGMDALLSTSEARICQTFRVPPIIVGAKVGLDRSTYANYAEARQSFWQDTLTPLYQRLAAVIQSDLLPDFAPSPGEEFTFDLSGVAALQENEDARWARALGALQAGALTINDFRAYVGQTPFGKEGDVLLLPSGVTVTQPADLLAKPEPAAPPAPDTPDTMPMQEGDMNDEAMQAEAQAAPQVAKYARAPWQPDEWAAYVAAIEQHAQALKELGHAPQTD